MVVSKTKRQYKKELMYVVLSIFLIGGLGVVSGLLFDKIQDKGGEQVQTIIVASILTYLGGIQLAYRLLLDILLYRKRFKAAKEQVVEIIESTSAYKPKEVKKIIQNDFVKNTSNQEKMGDNYVRISEKEIVIVYGKEFETHQEYWDSIKHTQSLISEHIRNKKK